MADGNFPSIQTKVLNNSNRTKIFVGNRNGTSTAAMSDTPPASTIITDHCFVHDMYDVASVVINNDTDDVATLIINVPQIIIDVVYLGNLSCKSVVSRFFRCGGNMSLATDDGGSFAETFDLETFYVATLDEVLKTMPLGTLDHCFGPAAILDIIQ